MAHHILLVEDERIVALQERHALEQAGYAVTVVEAGEAAVDTVREDCSIDLILMDINLGPGIDGVAASRQILEHRELPIVFCTSHSDRETVDRVGEIVHYGYVVKTTGPHVLIESVSTAFQLVTARRAQEETRQKLELIAAHSHDGFAIMSESRIEYLSPSWKRMVGYGSETPFGDDLAAALSHIHEDDRKSVIHALSEHEDEARFRHRYRVRRADGSIYWAEDEVTRLGTTANDRRRTVVVSRDITEQVAAEQMLNRQRARYQALYYSSFLTVVIYDRDARIVSGNRTKIGGTSPEELIGRALEEIVPEMYEQTLARIRECLDDGEPLEFVDKLPVGETVRWFQSRFEPLPGGAGEEDLVMVISDDITEAYAHGLDFARQSELVDAVTRFAPVFIYVYDIEEKRNIWVNAAYEAFLRDITVDDATQDKAQRDTIFSFIHPEDRAELIARENVWESDPSPPPDIPIRVRDGDSWRWLLNRAAPLVRKADRTAKRIIGFLIDISELKATETKLEETVRTNQMLLVEMNHRIKNNLHLARSLISMTQDEAGVDLSDLDHRIAAIGFAHESLLSAGGSDTIALREYLERVVGAVFDWSGKKRIAKDINLPDCRVPARDAVTLGLIVNEAATNAAKHAFDHDAHQFQVGVAQKKTGCVFCIRNTGAPFPEDVGFQNSDSLGLKLIRMLAEQLGGEAQLHRGQDTRIEITFAERPLCLGMEES